MKIYGTWSGQAKILRASQQSTDRWPGNPRQTKSTWYAVLNQGDPGDLVTTQDPYEHQRLLDSVKRAYRKDGIDRLQPHIDDAVDRLVQQIDLHLDQDIDLVKVLQVFAYGILRRTQCVKVRVLIVDTCRRPQ